MPSPLMSKNPPRECPAAKSGFIFDHLPKTGGTALRAAFDQIFGASGVSPPVLGRTERWAEERFFQYRMIVGHFRYPVPFAGRSETRVRLTVLRDPIDRAISEYFYFRNNVERLPWHKLTMYAKDHDLYGYLELLESEQDIAISNRYAHHFASQVSRVQWRESRLLALAKEAISAYDLVGVQEQLPDFLDLFCATYKLPAVLQLPRANPTFGRLALEDLDSSARERLIRLNGADLELYAFASARFRERKRAIFRRFVDRAQDEIWENEPDPIARRSAISSQDRQPVSFGDRAVEIRGVQVSGEHSGPHKVRSGETVVITIVIVSHIDLPALVAEIQLVDDVGEIVFGTSTELLGETLNVGGGKAYDVRFLIRADVRHGRYSVTVGLHTAAANAERCLHWQEGAVYFDVLDGGDGPLVGYCKLDARVLCGAADERVPTKALL